MSLVKHYCLCWEDIVRTQCRKGNRSVDSFRMEASQIQHSVHIAKKLVMSNLEAQMH